MDPVEKAKKAMGGFEKAVSSLPGIAGYREKELRRSADKQVRDAVVTRLDEERRQLTAIQQELLSGSGLLHLAEVEKLGGRMQALSDRVRTAAYGYAPFFDAQKVKEAELDRLVEYDQALLASLAKIDELLTALRSAVQSNGDVKAATQSLGDQLLAMNDAFSHRSEAMHPAE
jgi:hypothetical protein